MGSACCLLIYFYVQDELSYDRFYKNAHRIYRLVDDLAGQEATSAAIPNRWGPLILEQLPEVVNVVRMRTIDRVTPLITYEEKDKKFEGIVI